MDPGESTRVAPLVKEKRTFFVLLYRPIPDTYGIHASLKTQVRKINVYTYTNLQVYMYTF